MSRAGKGCDSASAAGAGRRPGQSGLFTFHLLKPALRLIFRAQRKYTSTHECLHLDIINPSHHQISCTPCASVVNKSVPATPQDEIRRGWSLRGLSTIRRCQHTTIKTQHKKAHPQSNTTTQRGASMPPLARIHTRTLTHKCRRHPTWYARASSGRSLQ